MKTLAIIQARMGSTRFPGKVLKPINGKPMIQLIVERVLRAQRVDACLIATSVQPENDVLEELAHQMGIACFRGSENDVLSRFFNAASAYQPENVVRITGDCPLVESILIDQVVAKLDDSSVQYASNTAPPTFPDGLDVEAFRFEALKKAAREATSLHDKEHVTPYLRDSGNFNCANIESNIDYSDRRWTVDEPEDLEVVKNIYDHFGSAIDFSWTDVIELQHSHPGLFAKNKNFQRNQGAEMSEGQKLWNRAKAVIPGGNMLLSKRAEMFLPEKWPSYFSKAKGCKVWDMEGNAYKDFSFMGIGTNTLGYGHPEVDSAVLKTIANGNMSTLNCPEEVYLAEQLVEMHPWARGVRFTRAGGEANSVAIRIARAASGRDGVAVCGYHGWHDWYLSVNLGDKDNLAGHLLPGLDPNGVPRHLQGTTFPFEYNNIERVKSLISEHDIGVIKMEVVRNLEPTDGFLKTIRELATDNNIVLIFDECTSGFRQTFGGLHKQFDVEPDMAIFGKTLGNGYAVNAVIGKREVMEHAQSTFISSTFWTERIGSTAALATLKVMEEIESWVTITDIGNQVRQRWQNLANDHGLIINHFGLPALAGYTFQSPNSLAYKTLITQEMLKSGFLAGTSLYACIDHDPESVDQYFEALEPIYKKIAQCEDGLDVNSLLEGPVCHGGFQRLN